MQFLVIGKDGKDDHALERRIAARPAHIALGDKMRNAGQLLFAVAILDDNDKMTSSVLVCEFESRQDLDAYLKQEPYVVGGVWQSIDIKSCKVGPSFADISSTKEKPYNAF